LDEDNGENSEHDIEMMCKAMGKSIIDGSEVKLMMMISEKTE